MRLLIVGLNYAPEPVGIGPYTTGMAAELARRGHQVWAVVGRPYYPQWRPYPGFGNLAWRRAHEHGVDVVRCPHYLPALPTGIRRILHYLSFALAALLPALRTAWRQRPQVVICVAPSLLAVAVARLAAWLVGARLWLHVQDFEVEAAFATGLLSDSGVVARLARTIENRLIGLADRVSTISPQMAARLQAKGVPAARVREVRNWAAAAPGGTGLGNGPGLRHDWHLGTAKVALYSGNIANKQGIEIVIDAARQLVGRTDIAFVICGEGPNRRRLERFSAGLVNVQFRDLQPSERLGELLSLATVHLLPQIAGAADLVLPSKLTNMLASGLPVIATAAPGTGLHAEVEGCGILVPPGDGAALAAAIVTLADDPELAARLGQACSKRAAQRWSQQAIIDQFEHELVQIAG